MRGLVFSISDAAPVTRHRKNIDEPESSRAGNQREPKPGLAAPWLLAGLLLVALAGLAALIMALRRPPVDHPQPHLSEVQDRI